MLATARLDWIFDSLFVGSYGLFGLGLVSNESLDAPTALALDLGILINSTLPLVQDQNTTTSRRRVFLNYLQGRIIDTRLFIDPCVRSPLGTLLGNTLLDLAESVEKKCDDDKTFVSLFVAKFYYDLPQPISSELTQLQRFKDYIGLEHGFSIQFEGVEFRAEDLWKAVQCASKAGPITITSTNGKDSFELSIMHHDDKSPYFELVHIASGKKMTMNDPILSLAYEDENGIEKILRKNLEWFDCADGEQERAIADILVTSDPIQRLILTEMRRAGSAEMYYRSLKFRLNDLRSQEPSMSEDFSLCLPPSITSLVNHYRLPKESMDIADDFGKAADELLADVGLTESLNRYPSVPIMYETGKPR